MFGICGLFVCSVRVFVLCVCVVALCLTPRSARARLRKCVPYSCVLVLSVGFVHKCALGMCVWSTCSACVLSLCV